MATKISRLYQRVPFFCKAKLTVLSEKALSQQSAHEPLFGTAMLTALPADHEYMVPASVNAYTFDISLGGVGLNAAVSYPCGCTVRVSFYLKGPGGERVEQVLGRVAYVKADESGTRVGIEFQEPVEESTHPELTRRLLSL